MMTADELLLAARALPSGGPERPWYIGLLLGVAGWFAGLLLLVFLGAVFMPKSGPGALAFGVVMVAAAFALFRLDRDGAFVSQLALALSIAGQFALLFGLHEALFSGASPGIASIAFAGFILQVAMVLLLPNNLHRVMSTLFACIAWAVFVRYVFWDKPFLSSGPKITPSLGMALLGWVMAWVPAAGALYLAVRKEPSWMAAGRAALVRPVATGLILGLGFATLLSHPFESFTFWGASADVRQGWLALWPLLSALASLGAMAAAFALGSRGLLGLCALAALLHMSHFYYAMGASLLFKSLLMLAMGAACIAAARALRKRTA
jgi:hypothetical protein